MVDRYGKTLAELKISHSSTYDLSNMADFMQTRMIQWQQKPYRIAPYSMTVTMRQLLQSWNYTKDHIRIMNMMGV